MFPCHLLGSSIIIYVLFQNTVAVDASYQQCESNGYLWFCRSGMQCGERFGTCKDRSGSFDTATIVVFVAAAVFLIVITVMIFRCWCGRRKRLASDRLPRSMQNVTETNSQQQVPYYVDLGASMNTDQTIVEEFHPHMNKFKSKALE